MVHRVNDRNSYLRHCDELSVLNLRAMAAKTTMSTSINTSMELDRHSRDDSRDSWPREEEVPTSSKTDRLGWRFDSICASDLGGWLCKEDCYTKRAY
jgi:hypothetical protein